MHKEVTVNNGKPTYASSNLPEEQLGIQLRRQGLLSDEGLTHSLGVALKEHRPLPEVLVRLGLIEREPVETHLEQMIRGRLLELFRWTSGKISSHPGYVDAAPIDYEFNPLHLIREGIQSIAGHDGPSSWLRQQTDKTFILTGESPKPLEYMGITREAIGFLERFIVPMSVAEIIEMVIAEQIDHEEIAAAILVAFQVGFLAAVAE